MEFGLISAFAFCVILLLVCLKFTTINWKIKAAMMILALPIVFAFYRGLISILGLPVGFQPECVMLIDGIDIREPHGNDPGIIYIWYIDVDNAVATGKAGIPKSIHIPYSKSDAKTMAKAQKESKDKPVYMQFKKGKKADAGDDDDDADGNPEAGDGLMKFKSQKHGKGKHGDMKVTGSGNDDRESEGYMDFAPPPFTLPNKE